MKIDELISAFNREPQGMAAAAGAADDDSYRWCGREHFVYALERARQFLFAHELLRQGDVRQVIGIEAQPARPFAR
jgi:hypothetical protein